MAAESTRSEVLQGTLDLMVLQTLHVMGRLHGYGIARRLLLEPQQESDRRPTGSVHHKRPFLAHVNVKKRSS